MRKMADVAVQQFRFRDVFTARLATARFAIVRFRAGTYHESTERLRCAA
jgi:hypothetical protein